MLTILTKVILTVVPLQKVSNAWVKIGKLSDRLSTVIL